MTLLDDKRINKIKTILQYLLKRKIKGITAEVGVYGGDISRMIAETFKKKHYAFDTFEGLQDVEKVDGDKIENGMFKADYDMVKKNLNLKNIEIVKGYFPKTFKKKYKKDYAFVHIDVDTYKSTLNCIDIFYPLVVKKGFIVIDDYNCSKTPGAKEAIDWFVKKNNIKLMIGEHPQAIIQK
jgi:O-methyltransferase